MDTCPLCADVDTIVALIANADKNVFPRQEIAVKVCCLHAYGGDVLDAGGNHAEDTGIAGFWRRQSTNETWTGRGKPPKWLSAEIAAGSTLEDFLV